jgi:hypothetical protein
VRALLILSLAAPVAAQEPPVLELELTAPRRTVYAGELVPLVIRLAYDRTFFAAHAIPAFGRAVDVPVHLGADWLGRVRWLEAEQGAEGLTCALGDRVVRGRTLEDRVQDGRRFTVLELEGRLPVETPGDLRLAGLRARFSHTTRFEEDFLQGRRPVDRFEAEVMAAPLRLEVHALPEEGRPAGFGGAIGALRVEAELRPREAQVGEVLKFRLRILGPGTESAFAAPALGPLEGWHVLGHLETRAPGAREIVYDVVPLREGLESFPPVQVPYFEPGPPAHYSEAATEPIPVTVRPGIEGQKTRDSTPLGGGPGIDALRRIPALRRGSASPGPELALAWALLGPGLLAAGLVAWRRRREADRRDPGRVRARRAIRRLRREARGIGGRPAWALARYLAERTGLGDAAAIAPEATSRLAAAGVPEAAAQAAAGLVLRGVVAEYGGGAASPGWDEVLSAARTIESALRARRPRLGRSDPILIPLLAGLGVLVALASCREVAAPEADLLRDAEAAYAAGDPVVAFHIYAGLAQAGAEPRGLLCCNAGTAAHRAGRFTDALLWYRRARLDLPRDPELGRQLALAEDALGLQEPETRGFGAVSLRLLDLVTMGELAALVAMALALGAVLLTLRGRHLPRLAVASALLLGLVLAAGFAHRHLAARPRALVIARDLPLHAEPHPDAPRSLRLPAGTQVEVLALSDRWALLRDPRGSGWAPATAIALVD